PRDRHLHRRGRAWLGPLSPVRAPPRGGAPQAAWLDHHPRGTRRRHGAAALLRAFLWRRSGLGLAQAARRVDPSAQADGRGGGAARRGSGRSPASPCRGMGVGGFFLMVLNARMGVEGFYARYGYQALGKPFQENTVPHIRMTKRLRP